MVFSLSWMTYSDFYCYAKHDCDVRIVHRRHRPELGTRMNKAQAQDNFQRLRGGAPRLTSLRRRGRGILDTRQLGKGTCIANCHRNSMLCATRNGRAQSLLLHRQTSYGCSRVPLHAWDLPEARSQTKEDLEEARFRTWAMSVDATASSTMLPPPRQPKNSLCFLKRMKMLPKAIQGAGLHFTKVCRFLR